MSRLMVIGFRVACILAFIVITWLALTSSPIASELSPWPWDKANHFSAFITLAFLVDFSFPKRHWRDMLKWLLLLGYGIGIEYMQRWLGTRDFDVHDMFADALGIAGYLVIRPLLERIPILADLRMR